MASNTHLFLLTIFLANVLLLVSSDKFESEAKTLLKFKNSLSNATALNDWDESTSLCDNNRANWRGVLCSSGKFLGLRLEGMGLGGRIDTDALAELPSLLTISFMNNNFEGSIPNINKLGGLRGFYISNNRFSGEIPKDAFAGTRSLRKVFMANNEFKGEIPKSLGDLTKLVLVHLENNQFEGSIPFGLSNQNSSSFSGNLRLCGKPLNPCPPSKKRKISKTVIIIIIVVVVIIVTLIITIASYYCYKSSKKESKTKSAKLTDTLDQSSNEEHSDRFKGRKGNYEKPSGEKLEFVRNDRVRFNLQDLLMASAEVLGSGSFGSSYKAVLLSDGQEIVAKRYRHQMSNVSKVEFYEHLKKLGRLSHPNLLPLVAFYYKKEEKLLISDFAHNGSLASHLHGKHGPNQPAGLDWAIRLKIVKGVAKGLDYLNKELKTVTQVPHGHLKSTNVLLDSNFEALLADYGLIPIVNKQHAQNLMSAYKSPEFSRNSVITTKSDVWCLGILILEILTGKFPANYLSQVKGENVDLASWVNSVVKEEWTGEVFDIDMQGREKGEGEMVKLLKIGMSCCESDVQKRMDFNVAISKIQELKVYEDDDENESYASADGHLDFSSSPLTAITVEQEASSSGTK